ncbi:MAG: hypothetical protein CME70_22665 [Halobacteriovorax sp.]|nr:hypothetical protein [Halobacteriovorax sp.]|tara:strand:+ start:43153 stop:43635 length:483 start_codon:yes stop_codon:yes gene_type:complete
MEIFKQFDWESFKSDKKAELLSNNNLMLLLTAPFIYAMIIPAVILDLFLAIYQRVCFPVYGIEKVKRNEYIVIDRHKVSFLNGIDKLNCVYCGYFNGLIAYAREVAARTERHWCPIRHLKKPKGSHEHYDDFMSFNEKNDQEEKWNQIRRGKNAKTTFEV